MNLRNEDGELKFLQTRHVSLSVTLRLKGYKTGSLKTDKQVSEQAAIK